MEIGIVEDNKKLVPTMNDDDIKQLKEALDEVDKLNYNLTFNNVVDEVESGETRLINTTIDPATGSSIITDAKEVSNNDPDFNEILNDPNIDLNFDTTPISLDEIKNFINNSSEDPVIKGQLSEDNISIDDLSSLLDLLIKYQNKEQIDSVFSKLPKACQDIVLSTMGPEYANVYSNQANSLKNTLAELFLDQFISSIMMERANHSINTGIEKVFNKATGEIGDTIVGYTEERNRAYREEIEKIEDPDKKQKALDILAKIDNAYQLNELKDFCKKCKIRKIDMEHPTEKNKDIDMILSKYDNNPKFNIYNIYNAQQVLERNLSTENKTYSSYLCRAFLIAFAKYCMNFSPTNTDEHIFMFYTIYNILLTDVNKGDKAEISNKFLDNVRECITNLIQRNEFLATV